MTSSVDAVLIAGPTASGKSKAAIELAERIGGIIINADSMQVYREVRILSARPSEEDAARVPHLLYGHVSVQEAYSAGSYQADAANALREAKVLGRIPVFVGGTGMYFGVLTEGIADIPPIASHVRERMRRRLKEVGVAALHAELASRDPETAAQLRPSDPQRVLRAHEVLEATGRPLASWQKEMGKPVLEGLRLARFVLDIPRPELRARIERRFRAMIGQGAIAEAATMKGLDPSLPAAKILGLRELLALGRGEVAEEEAIALAVTATRQFAKRQMTWFRNRMKDWVWLSDPGAMLHAVRPALNR